MAEGIAAAYDEHLRVPLRWWVQATMLLASLWLAMVVALPSSVALAIAGVGGVLLAAALMSFGSARISVRDGVLYAGRARIACVHLGQIDALDPEASRRVAGRDADARAYLVLRPYLKRAVRIEITDPADPVPYWLVSSRHPEDLARALTSLAGPSLDRQH